MTEGLQCNKDLLGSTATKWSPTVAAATATCSSRFGFSLKLASKRTGYVEVV